MATMSVIGIDFGNESCYVAVAKAGGIETIANDYSLRATPSCIAFSEKNRILGVAAKNQQVTNMKNTVYCLKRLLGRKFRDPHVQKELQLLPFTIVEEKGGNIGIKVRYLNEENTFSPEQCLAMLLTKLKDIAANALQTPINDCVISVPSYYTNNERKALLDSATIAGLNVLRLMNEPTATALAYGIYKQDLPNPEEKARNVVFVDCGHCSLQVSAVAFHKGKLRMLSCASDPYLGGRDFDLLIADYFCKQFQTKYGIDAKSSPRAFIRLLGEVEKLKKQMSANSTMLPLNIECFMDDKDVSGEMKRADMENLAKGLLQRVETTLKQCLTQSGLDMNDINSVEIVGGSSRIPAIKVLIERVFNRTPSTTLNQDEAVARGCALQCAILSPAVRVRDFSVTDVQVYPITVAWDASPSGESAGEIEVFPVNHAVPFSKMLTFYRQEPFVLRARYSGNIPYPDKEIGKWAIKDIRPNAEGKPQKVKVKVRVNLHGIMTISSASLFEAKETPEPETPEEQQTTKGGEQQQQGSAEQQNGPPQNQPNDVDMDGQQQGGAAPEEGTEKDKKKKQTVKSIELPIESLTFGFSNVELNQFTEQEFKMIASDKQEKERADARNAFEEYVYELRNKVSSEDELAPYMLEKDRTSLVSRLDDMENWLYEEGEDCNKQVYVDKLASLKEIGDPVNSRRHEHETRPGQVEEFARSLQLTMKALEQVKSKNPKYAHLSDEDVKKADQAFNHAYQWLEQTRQKTANAPLHLPPSVTVAQIRQERSNFESTINSVLNKPAPKAQTPPEEEQKTAGDQQQQQPQKEQNGQPQQNSDKQQENMEWSSTK